MAALGGRFASQLRSVTGGDLGLCTSPSGFNLFFASAQSFIAFDRRKLKCSRFTENDCESFASTGANPPRPLPRVEYLGRHAVPLISAVATQRSSRVRNDRPIEIQSYATNEDDERMNLNSGEPLKGECPILHSFLGALRSMIEPTRNQGLRTQAVRAVCRVRPWEGMTKCIAGSKRAVRQDGHWLCD